MTDVAIMASGGLDSLIAWHYANHIGKSPEAVFLNYGQPYLEKELESVSKLFPDVTYVTADLAHPHLNNVPTVDKQEVFGRNLLIAFYGALIAPEVWMVALSTENNPTAVRDKTPEFFQLTSGLLSFLLKDRQFTTTIKSPFDTLTKSAEIRLGKMLGISEGTMQQSVSCYSDTHQNCGLCSTCFKRWIAMVNNDVPESYPNIKFNQYGHKIIEQMRQIVATRDFDDEGVNSRYSKDRLLETNAALTKADWSPLYESNVQRKALDQFEQRTEQSIKSLL